MRKNKWRLSPLIVLTVFTLFNSACAQNQPFTGLAYVTEEKLAEKTTVLLNNSSYLIPIQNLEEQKIASIHFTNLYAAGFDSLLNKYAKVAVYNGSNYSGIKSLDDLSSDLKFYNTLIVQVNDADLNNPLIIDFI